MVLKGKNWKNIIALLRMKGGERNKQLAWKLEQLLLAQKTLH